MSTAFRKKMHQDLQLAGLSEGTQHVYLRAVKESTENTLVVIGFFCFTPLPVVLG
jgi:hypothetical protein